MTFGTSRIFSLSVIPAVAACGILLAACSPEVRTHGAMPQKSVMAQIEPGKSTRADIAQALGTPSTTSMFDNGEVWYYIGARRQQVSFHASEELERQVLIFTFDKGGVMDEMKTLDKNSGQEVTLVSRKTPSAGHELTIMEQLLGNIGRFNSTSDPKSALPR
ncbi:outer membrane protein assembly factor BamE [Novispirillum itersonii]|uniref:outer membrane protein assembly factor BamE n=1 Tax=Novispirillum itersonii TaxID=189 RepID=UPI000367E7F5|nr:outer membrane protein assembly factor BamE [Novispirillum itersonii]